VADDLVDPRVPAELVEAVTDVLMNVPPGRRQSAVATFDVVHFNSRVAEWLHDQIKRASTAAPEVF